MKMFDKLKQLFSGRERDSRLEELLSEEIICEDEQRQEEARASEDVMASVITYISSNDDDALPRMDVLVDEFKGRVLPEPGSIIWIDVAGVLRSFRTVRIDYVCNDSDYDSMRVYIVVCPAQKHDIVAKPFFGVNS